MSEIDQSSSTILVVDLEATCANDASLAPEAMEIIEIGAVWAKPDGTVLNHFQAFVRPLQRPTLTPFCVGLTGIQQSEVDAAPLFPVAANALRAFAAKRREPGVIWVSWGDYDHKQIDRDCARHRIECPLQLPHENLKRLFAKSQRIGKEVTLATACELTKGKLEGRYHRALDDAINTAHLLPWALGSQSLGGATPEPP
jgi:inhibitor of KinA sporulation pathway (predicted exonuclease)